MFACKEWLPGCCVYADPGNASLRALNYRGPHGAEAWLELEHPAGLWESPLLLPPLESNTTSWAFTKRHPNLQNQGVAELVVGGHDDCPVLQ